MMNTDEKFLKLKDSLSLHSKIAIAYSGGVDSAFLLGAAVEAGCEVLAVTADSELIPQWERLEAAEIATHFGVRQIVVRIPSLEDSHVYANSPQRCYFCKRNIMATLKRVALENGFMVLAEGSNSSDSSDFRPGMKAVREERVFSPLLEAGLVKEEIREFSQKLGIPGYDRPSCACLASRVPYGTELTADILIRIEKAEVALRGLGFKGARVRCHDDTARIEVPVEDFQKMIEPAIRFQIMTLLTEAGFIYVTLDLNGYRTGSMNDALGSA